MTNAILTSAAVLLQHEYPWLTAEGLKAALDGAGGPDLTINETCTLLKRCRASVNTDIKTGKLESYKIGGSVRVRRSSVDRLMHGQPATN